MNDARLLTLFLAVLFACREGALAEEKPVEIPLKSIWWNSVIGAQSLRSLEPELLVYRDTPEKIEKYSTPEARAEVLKNAKRSLVLKLEEAVRKLPLATEGNKPTPGFAVVGTGRAALPGMCDVLVNGKQPLNSLPAGTDISLVFFSYPTQPYVALDRVERDGHTFCIRYALVSHGELNISSSLALIPVGRLSPGKYRVEMLRSANESQHNQRGFPAVAAKVEQYTVCRSFEFTIGRSGSPKPSDQPHAK